jgi:hypothetical protein
LGIDVTQGVYSQLVAPAGAPPKEGDWLKGPFVE